MGLACRALGVVLLWLVSFLPRGRQEWGEAVYAEAVAVPASGERARWLAGGIRVVAGQARLGWRSGWWLAVAAAATLAVRAGWHSGSTIPSARIDRVFLILLVVLLGLAPWVVRVIFGPVADNRTARVVRTAAYGLVCALVPVLIVLSGYAGARFENMHAMNPERWRDDMVSGAVGSSILLLVLIGAYAVAVLIMTARRPALSPVTLSIGAGSGAAAGLLAYALTPFGGVLHVGPFWLRLLAYPALFVLLGIVPIAAGIAVTGRTGRTGQGTAAGLLAGAAAALVVTVLTIPTMVAFPTHVPLKWANPDPNVPHGTLYELQMSVGDTAGRYLAVLILAPLLGAGLGAWGAEARRPRPTIDGARGVTAGV